MRTADYLSRLKLMAPRPTVYAVAQLMELPEGQVRHWYRGRTHPDTMACIRIAELLDLDPLQVIADVEAEREKDEGKKARWRELARKLSGSALVVICSAIGATADNSHAQQLDGCSLSSVKTVYELCAGALRRILQRFCPRGFGGFPAFGS